MATAAKPVWFRPALVFVVLVLGVFDLPKERENLGLLRPRHLFLKCRVHGGVLGSVMAQLLGFLKRSLLMTEY